MPLSPHVVLQKGQLSRLGGAEKYTLRIAKAFLEKNCRLTLLTSGKLDDAFNDPRIEVLQNEGQPSFSFRKVDHFDAFCTLKQLEAKGDVVFSMDRTRFQTHLRASNGVHAAYLQHRAKNEHWLKRLSFSINPLHRTLLNIEKQSFESPLLKVLFTNSYMIRDEILRFYSTDPSKIQVIHNGVEWKESQGHFDLWFKKKKIICERLQLDPNIFHFIFIGHNYERKGLEPLLQGLSLLKRNDFHLSVIGNEKNLGKFENLVKKNHLSRQVRFFGSHKDILSFYQMADCLVIPSFYDPFANVTVEALNMGLFVVSSKTNGGCEILNDQNGRTIENLFDPDSVAASLQTALENPKTIASSVNIRNSVRHLDFSDQVGLLTDITLNRT